MSRFRRRPNAPSEVRRPHTARGFTLVELLCVIAVIGVLATILVPTVSGARNAANKTKTRTQFAQWAAAIEQFRQEYGSYPQFYPQGLVNQNAGTTATQEHLFHDTLAGHRRDPSGSWLAPTNRTPPMPQAQNSRRIQFVAFSDADFVTQGDVTNAYNTAAQLNFLRDGFHNTSIGVVVDRNLDGVINGNDFTAAPRVVTPDTNVTITPAAADLPTARTGGIHAGVIFYCAPPRAATGADLIMSWK